MELDIFKKIEQKQSTNRENTNYTNDIEIELAKKLDAIEEFTVDRIEGEIVTLENRKNKEMITINKENLPENIKEGSILKKVNEKYILDEEKTKETEERIKEKMNKLWE